MIYYFPRQPHSASISRLHSTSFSHPQKLISTFTYSRLPAPPPPCPSLSKRTFLLSALRDHPSPKAQSETLEHMCRRANTRAKMSAQCGPPSDPLPCSTQSLTSTFIKSSWQAFQVWVIPTPLENTNRLGTSSSTPFSSHQSPNAALGLETHSAHPSTSSRTQNAYPKPTVPTCPPSQTPSFSIMPDARPSCEGSMSAIDHLSALMHRLWNI